jgi:lipopolysaccharide cholinephosphotransferase
MPSGKPNLTNRNLSKARKALFKIASLLDKKVIPYHLEGGTLLGIVRDRDLLPWDYDVDISIPSEYAVRLLKLRLTLFFMGYKISVRRSQKDIGPIKKGDYSIFKIKPTLGYFLYWFIPDYNKRFIVTDIFIKTKDETHTYWQAKEKVMRVENKYYESFETVTYHGHTLKVPNHYRDYLTEKYGDWSVPVKEWDCGENELTIVK